MPAPKKQATSSSFSRAQDLEKCPLMFRLKHIEKIPDPAPPLPAGQERPMEKGNRIHTLAENFVQNPLLPLPEALVHFERELLAFRKLHQKGKMIPERRYAFNKHWQEVDYRDWDNAIYRAVLDVYAEITPTRVLIVDYKTGKKAGNEVKHHEQAMEYAVCVALTNPNIQLFDVQIYYIEHPNDRKLANKFTRTQVLQGFQAMKRRHERVLNETIFEARPSKFSCGFCPYKAGMVGYGKTAYPGTGHCRRNVC